VLDRSRPEWAQARGHRSGSARLCGGICEGAQAFGKAIAEFQASSSMIADMEARRAGAGVFYWASQLIDDKSPDVGHFPPFAKLLASGHGDEGHDDAVSDPRGYRICERIPGQRMMRDRRSPRS